MKLFEVTMRDTDTAVDVICEVEAESRDDAQRRAEQEWGRPGLRVVRVKDTLFRSAAEAR